MKLLRYLYLPFSLLIIFHLILLPACSEDDEIKARYDSNLLVSWIGPNFDCSHRIILGPCPIFPPEEIPENCPCLYITSFRVTVSNFILKRIFEDFSEGDEFDFYQGRSYQINLKAATVGNPFVTPDFNATLAPSWYEVVSFQLDDFQIEVGSTQKPDLPVLRKQIENLVNILGQEGVLMAFQMQGYLFSYPIPWPHNNRLSFSPGPQGPACLLAMYLASDSLRAFPGGCLALLSGLPLLRMLFPGMRCVS